MPKYFINHISAINYYRKRGYSFEEIRDKIILGEVKIGMLEEKTAKTYEGELVKIGGKTLCLRLKN